MKKKYIITLLLLLLVAGGVSAKFIPSFFSSSPEGALPSLPKDSPYILLKVENPLVLQKGIASLLNLKGILTKKDRAEDAISIVELLISKLDMMKEVAVLLPPEDISRIYVSFIPVSDKFDAFLSNPGTSVFNVAKWQTDKGDGWRIAVTPIALSGANECVELYVLKTSFGSKSIVLMAENEQGIDKMLMAKKSSTTRLKIKRYNPGADYIQSGVSLKPIGGGDTKQSVTELALAADKSSAHIQIYTDYFSELTGRAVPKSGLKPSSLPILGKGELACVFACDIPYLSFVAMPTEKDPIGKLLEYAAPILGGQYTTDLKNIMTSGRLSAVVSAPSGSNKPSAAYLLVESTAKSELDRLYAMLSKFMKPSELKGWDSVCIADSEQLGLTGSIVAARRGDMLLLGMGALSDYSSEAAIPDSIKSFAAPNDLINFVATASLFGVAKEQLGDVIQSELVDYGVDISGLASNNIRIDAVQLRVITPEKADYGIYWSNAEK